MLVSDSNHAVHGELRIRAVPVSRLACIDARLLRKLTDQNVDGRSQSQADSDDGRRSNDARPLSAITPLSDSLRCWRRSATSGLRT